MTRNRKKFIKQLMAAGISRNTAESLAVWVQGSWYGYKKQLPAYLYFAKHRKELGIK